MKVDSLYDQAAAAWALLRRERGTITRIAVGLGIQPQAVWQWQVVPLHRLYDVARIAGRRWQDLRPDKTEMSGRMIKLLARQHNGASGGKSDLKSKRARVSTPRA